MANESQLELFTEDTESEKAETWKDRALAEDLERFRSAKRDEIDRRDVHAQATLGQISLEESGFSRRQAGRILTVGAARQVIEQSSRERAEAEAAREVELRREQGEMVQRVLEETST